LQFRDGEYFSIDVVKGSGAEDFFFEIGFTFKYVGYIDRRENK
jgi:hypothetical protein